MFIYALADSLGNIGDKSLQIQGTTSPVLSAHAWHVDARRIASVVAELHPIASHPRTMQRKAGV